MVRSLTSQLGRHASSAATLRMATLYCLMGRVFTWILKPQLLRSCARLEAAPSLTKGWATRAQPTPKASLTWRLMSKGKSLRSARGLDRQARALGGDVEARSSGAREARVRESRAVRGLILGTRTGTTLSLMTARWRTSVLPTSAVVESV